MTPADARDREIRRLKQRVAELEAELRTDDLMNILSRRGLMHALDAYVKEVDFHFSDPGRRKSLVVKALSIVFIDIDFFKHINDTHGHGVGDVVLREVAQAIKRSLRAVDIVGRYGGEEIVVGLVGADLARATQIAEELRTNVESMKLEVGGDDISVTASFGVSAMRSGMSLHQLLTEADEALYRAKAEGRNRVEQYG